VFIKNVILALESNYSYNRESSYYGDYFNSRKSLIIESAIETRNPDIYKFIFEHIIGHMPEDPRFLWNKYSDTLDIIKYKHEILGIPLNDCLIFTPHSDADLELIEYLISKNCPIHKSCYDELCTTNQELAAKVNPDTITRKDEPVQDSGDEDMSNLGLFD